MPASPGDVKDNDRQTTLQQYWAQPQQLQLEDGNTVKWQLRDAQHCFNLNALAKSLTTRWLPLISPPVFSALLINAGIDRGNTDEIVQSIADYIDVDDSPRFHGAEDSFYQSQTPPGIVPIRCFSDWRITSDKRHNRKHLSAAYPVCLRSPDHGT